MTSTRTSRKRFVRETGGHPRTKEWFDVFVGLTTTSGTQVGQNLTAGIAVDELKGMTVIRTIGRLILQPGTLNVRPVLSMGTLMMNDDAFSAGAFPDPADADEEPGWLWRESRVVQIATLDTSPNQVLQWDSRASRKFRGEDDNLVLVVEQSAVAVTCTWDGLVRVLVLKA